MARYVVGFMFSTDMKRVLLIEKKRPDWQRGKLNGIGGKVMDGETFYTAMSREFFEETGLRFDGWKFFCKLSIPPEKGWDDIYFAAATSGLTEFANSPTDEKVYMIDVRSVSEGQVAFGRSMPDNVHEIGIAPCLYNLPWLVRMGIDSLVHETSYDITERR